MNINKYFKNIYSFTKRNIKSISIFELIYRLLLCVFFIPLIIVLFNSSVSISGYEYIDKTNIANMFSNPIVIIFILLLSLLFILAKIFETIAIIIIYDRSYFDNKISFINLLKISLYKFKKLFKFNNICIVLLALFLIPILNIGLNLSVINYINPPKYIYDYLYSNHWIIIIIIIICILILILFIRMIYSIYYMVLENKNFSDAIKSSRKLIVKNIIKDILIIIGLQLFIFLLFSLFLTFYFFLLYILKILLGYIIANHNIITIIMIILTILCFFILSIFSQIISFAILSKLYYQHKFDSKEIITTKEYSKVTSSKFKIGDFIAGIIIIVCICLLTLQLFNMKDNINVQVTNIEVTGHRGASANYPENTMSAFVGAKEFGADWIELDVHQTKDKKLAVTHDSNLKRITGVNKRVIDLKYKDIKKLDAGSFFNSEFAGEYIPQLYEVIEYAKENNIYLNIELKPIGEEKDFEKSVIDLINKYDFKDMCVVASQSYKVLKNTKNIDSSITTLYVTNRIKEDISGYEYADLFSIELSRINNYLVYTVHKSNKKIFAWTANNPNDINKMIYLGVDNIITNDIKLTKDLIEQSNKSNILKEIIKLFK